MAQEMEFGLREKEEEVQHYKEKCENVEKREQKNRERMKKEVNSIR